MTEKQIAMTRTTEEFRKRFYLPGFTEFLINTVKNCLTCPSFNNASGKHQSSATFVVTVVSRDMFDIFGPLMSNVLKFVIRFIVKISVCSANDKRKRKHSCKRTIQIVLLHSYVARKIVSDLGSVITSKLIHELTGLLDIHISHSTLKHPQTMRLRERSHGLLKRILKLNTDAQWSDWHKYVPLATLIHNTSNYLSIGCCPNTVFLGKEPSKPLDL